MDYDGLKSLGLTTVDHIEKYSLRTEGEYDVLKIYYERTKGALIKKSEKFKFHRPRRTVKWDSSSNNYSEVSEVSPLLTKILAELDSITGQEKKEADLKQQVLEDLKHLERVVQNKIKEIEAKLEQM